MSPVAIVWPCPLAVDAYAAAGRDLGFPPTPRLPVVCRAADVLAGYRLIALWLGHAGVRSTDAYVHADISIRKGPSHSPPRRGPSLAVTAQQTRCSRSSKTCNYARTPTIQLSPARQDPGLPLGIVAGSA